jgi:hypothetical protein
MPRGKIDRKREKSLQGEKEKGRKRGKPTGEDSSKKKRQTQKTEEDNRELFKEKNYTRTTEDIKITKQYHQLI